MLGKFGFAWRVLAYLKKISTSLESIAKSQEMLARMAQSQWEREYIRPKPKPIVYGRYNAEEAEREIKRRIVDGEETSNEPGV